MVDITFALVGFGNVGKAFVRLLERKQEMLRSQYGLHFRVTGVATGRHGIAIDPQGLDTNKLLAAQDLNQLSKEPAPASVMEFIQRCPADVLFENSPVNHEDGQPAVDHIRAGLQRGMHVITANKGPLVHAYAELMALAASRGVSFKFESTVMDGAPIFSLFPGALPLVELSGFHGVLNSCTNLILGRMETGESFEQAVAYAQSIGIAETDPSEDIDGWDAAVKTAALATVLMNAPMTPQMVDRTGIRGVTPDMIAAAAKSGERWKLVCRAFREGGNVQAVVAPQRVTPDSPLFAINGTSSYVQFESDVLPGLGIVENDPGPETTAYGLLADLIRALQETGAI